MEISLHSGRGGGGGGTLRKLRGSSSSFLGGVIKDFSLT